MRFRNGAVSSVAPAGIISCAPQRIDLLNTGGVTIKCLSDTFASGVAKVEDVRTMPVVSNHFRTTSEASLAAVSSRQLKLVRTSHDLTNRPVRVPYRGRSTPCPYRTYPRPRMSTYLTEFTG